MNATRPHRVVVVGGGILGASAAAHLARRGMAVTLVTSGDLADGASGRSLSWLNSSGERSEAYHRLRLLGIDRYRTWAARRPDSADHLRFDGAIKWARPGSSLQPTFARERSRGYDAIWVPRNRIAEHAPDVRPGAVAEEGAIVNPGEGWVDLPPLVAELVAEAVAGGARLVARTAVRAVATDADGVVGVHLADGAAIPADRVVLAAGAATPALLATVGVALPEATVPSCIVHTAPLAERVRMVMNTPRVAVRPLPDGGLALDSGWAARTVRRSEDGTWTVPAETVTGLLDEASRVLARTERLRARRVAAGPKPIPADGAPVVGAVPVVPGLSVLFTHSGATLGLILGELLAEEIDTGAASPVLERFRIDRFDGSATAGPAADDDAWTPVVPA
ncbi:FAD-binding oxidoreductase [Microbacterium resistens]|uniref:NAD(P)/FAD-dependent oxidoreductase n=1 Tax=Microbacterium resistens TaxID=156977 RepID=UPI001C5735A0|nr:FAD-dependent oxidoreductase [Microbacterium resistens]MBW1638658.1 FAD-binding oxidoreductase [Microbacterium resistens]